MFSNLWNNPSRKKDILIFDHLITVKKLQPDEKQEVSEWVSVKQGDALY